MSHVEISFHHTRSLTRLLIHGEYDSFRTKTIASRKKVSKSERKKINFIYNLTEIKMDQELHLIKNLENQLKRLINELIDLEENK
jgi:hypothetical protein